MAGLISGQDKLREQYWLSRYFLGEIYLACSNILHCYRYPPSNEYYKFVRFKLNGGLL